MWARLLLTDSLFVRQASGLRPTFLSALVPFTHCSPFRKILRSVDAAPASPRPLFPSPCFSVSSVPSVVCFLRVLCALCTTNPQILLSARRFSCRHGSELPARPQPPSLFGCGPAALWFSTSVSSVVCFSCALPTPSHNDPQIFFPFLFNYLATPPSSSSCFPLVC